MNRHFIRSFNIFETYNFVLYFLKFDLYSSQKYLIRIIPKSREQPIYIYATIPQLYPRKLL